MQGNCRDTLNKEGYYHVQYSFFHLRHYLLQRDERA
jgi:hypothetical protein